MYFPDRGCVRTLRTLYVYATATLDNLERSFTLFRNSARNPELLRHRGVYYFENGQVYLTETKYTLYCTAALAFLRFTVEQHAE